MPRNTIGPVSLLLPHGMSIVPFRGAVVLGCVIAFLAGRRGLADDWPFFRGPNNNGISTETGWTVRWPDSGPKVAWRKDVGIGASSVVVVGDRVIAMGSRKNTNQDVVSCLGAETGQIIWQFVYDSKFDARQFEGGTASTPTVDGHFVYTLGYLGQVHCLDLKDGHVVWSRHLVDDFGGRYSSWKYAGSPLVAGDQVVFDTGGDGNSTVALNKKTGRKIWGVGSDLAGYATPIPFDHSGQQADRDAPPTPVGTPLLLWMPLGTWRAPVPYRPSAPLARPEAS